MIRLRPVYKTMLWGGQRIRGELGQDTGELSVVAESWELSTHPNGETLVAEGEFCGLKLTEYFDRTGWEKLGWYGMAHHRLPLMVKYIDAAKNLSVQVHPADAYAELHEHDSGKNEMWYILSADEGAFIYLGFRRDVTREEVRSAVEGGTVEELLNRIPVKRGEMYYIPAGTVHAIGAGCFICEIQQTSDATYRLYDYGRLDADGRPRALHLEKALDVLRYTAHTERGGDFSDAVRAAKDMFKKDELILEEFHGGRGWFAAPERGLAAMLILGGEGTLGGRKVSRGQTFLMDEPSALLTGDCHALFVGYRA